LTFKFYNSEVIFNPENSFQIIEFGSEICILNSTMLLNYLKDKVDFQFDIWETFYGLKNDFWIIEFGSQLCIPNSTIWKSLYLTNSRI